MKSSGTTLVTFAFPSCLPSLGGEGLVAYSVRDKARTLGVRGRVGEPLTPFGVSISAVITCGVVLNSMLLFSCRRWSFFGLGVLSAMNLNCGVTDR